MSESRRAVVYARISQDRTGAGLGVQRQADDCQALAARLGWTVVGTYTDDDISAYSGRPRPAYRRMLADLEAGAATAVLAWHSDRLHRSPLELEEYVDLCERRGITTQTVQAGELDLSTPSGRAVARTLGAWARFESEHKGERIRRAMQQSAEAGRFTGGAYPYGWTRGDDGVPTIEPRAARVVREAADRLLAGASLGSIVADLNRRDEPTATGGTWNYTSLRQVLSRARNAGLSELHGEIVGPSTFPAILTEDQWRAILAVFADPTRRRSQSNRVRHLLAGLARCECGAPVRSATVTRRDGTGVTNYRCKVTGPGHVSKVAEYVDRLVSAFMVALLARPDVLDSLADDDGPDLAALRDEAVTLRTRLDGAADTYAAGGISAAQLARITRQIEDRLTTVEATMSTPRRAAAVAPLAGPDAAARWEAATIEQRRAAIDALAVVTLKRTDRAAPRAFDPRSVTIEPRT